MAKVEIEIPGGSGGGSCFLEDKVIKYGKISINGNDIEILANAFKWRVDQIEFLTTPYYQNTINVATEDYFRKDLLVGNNAGGYEIIEGEEGLVNVSEPDVPGGKIKLAVISVFGNSLEEPAIESPLFLEDILVSLPTGDTLGAYSNGQIIPSAGRTSEQVINLLAKKVQNPIIIPPTFTISLPNYTQREVGSTYSELMTANFNRGQIKGKLVAGVWQENTQQDFRAGAASTYTLDGSSQAGNTKTVSRVLALGNNTFSGSVNFLTGVQPTNSASENYDTPYPAGTMSDSKIIPADYPVFYGTLLPSQDIADIDLSTFTKITNINANNTVSIPYSNVSDKKLVVLIPSEKTAKTKWYVSALNSGNIGGVGDLFASPVIENQDSPTALWSGKSYRVYISTRTSLNTLIELRN